MIEIISQTLMLAYASTGIIATIGYVPTIKDLVIHRKMSANIASYSIWTFCSAVTFLYSMILIQDLLLRIVTGLNFGCCALILGLALSIKKNN